MAFDELKRRISLLQRGQLKPTKPAASISPPSGAEADITQYFPEGIPCKTAHGDVFVCKARLHDVYSEAPRLTRRYLATFGLAVKLARRDSLPRFLEPLASADAATTALIDAETAGLHGRPLFLIGLAQYQGDDLVLTQYFARNYSEEVGILDRLAAVLPNLKLLISFNGKAFDWPFVRDRMVYHRLHWDASFAHLDLLHPSRRRWRCQLPNCKLQTLERYLCGRWRTGDIPGDQIPQRYHDFVREQDARLVAPIFHHNRLDLITMLELLVALGSEGQTLRSVPPGRTGSRAAESDPTIGPAERRE